MKMNKMPPEIALRGLDDDHVWTTRCWPHIILDSLSGCLQKTSIYYLGQIYWTCNFLNLGIEVIGPFPEPIDSPAYTLEMQAGKVSSTAVHHKPGYAVNIVGSQVK